ncbi:hypothetical protein BUALT_Bualt01G0028700 [Buddleja alternifolia]|uniref:ABC transporter domain-containing protein n=1 Tax=Buddleja alternifolia TaxID=168488 RepID=A0AAV6Y413_9LAMI|nr:hypothetical protein BUALT_Bualt01G0028700 [Buddleja alternifolia]
MMIKSSLCGLPLRGFRLMIEREKGFSSKVGIDVRKVEVRYEHLSVEGDAYVGSRALPTLLNSTLNVIEGILEKVKIVPSKKRAVKILHDVSGIVKPSRMTLLLGPPGAGKTILLKALAGKLEKDLRVSGRITPFPASILQSRRRKYSFNPFLFPDQLLNINCGKSKKQKTVQDYHDNSIKIGTRVHLFCHRIPKSIVAQGVVVDLIGGEKKDGHAFVKVYVEKALIPNEKLLRPQEGARTIGEAIHWEFVDVMEI